MYIPWLSPQCLGCCCGLPRLQCCVSQCLRTDQGELGFPASGVEMKVRLARCSPWGILAAFPSTEGGVLTVTTSLWGLRTRAHDPKATPSKKMLKPTKCAGAANINGEKKPNQLTRQIQASLCICVLYNTNVLSLLHWHLSVYVANKVRKVKG